MPVDALAIVAGNRLFSIERCPDNSGVRFVLTEPGGKRKWSAAIIDCGDEFALAMGSEDGIRLISDVITLFFYTKLALMFCQPKRIAVMKTLKQQ